MTRDEYNVILATEPATRSQAGTVAGHMERLGYTGRAERLAMTARLAGRERLDSTKSLTMGEAGRLCGLLSSIRDRAELEAIVAAGHEDQAEDAAPDAAGPGMTLAGAIAASLAAAIRSWEDWQAVIGSLRTPGT